MTALTHDASWYQERCGCFTASLAPKAFSTAKKTLGQPLESAVMSVATERLTCLCNDHFVTSDMQYGIDHEKEAIAYYRALTGNKVEKWGDAQEFVVHPTIDWLGATPDGLVGTDGLVECKCPSRQTHTNRLLAREVPSEYIEQLLVQLVVTGRKWVDFIDYRHDFPEDLKLMIARFEPTEEQLKECEQRCIAFLNRVEEVINQIESNV